MRKLPLFLIVIGLLFVYSCKKNNSGQINSDATGWLSSITSYSPGSRQSVVDSFSDDSTHRIATYKQFAYDSSGGSPNSASWSAVFSLSGDSSSPPATYTNDLPGVQETHQLTYDAQGRILRDSSLGSSGWIIYFGYPNGNIAMNAYYDGTLANSLLDTLFISGGNVSASHLYLPNDAETADSLEGNLKFGFSGVANPAYHPAITSKIGPLMYILAISGYGGNYDAISQKVFNSESGVIDGLPPNTTLHYTLTLDNLGRLSRQSTSFGGNTGIIAYRYY